MEIFRVVLEVTSVILILVVLFLLARVYLIVRR